MRTFGEICLLLAFVGSGYGACACLLTGRAASLTRSGVWSIIAAWCALTGTLVVLSAALIARDFQFDYVAQYTSRTLPWQFALAALWVGQAGSLLLWAWLTGSAALVFLAATGAGSRYRLPAFGLLAAQLCLLIAIMVFAADPMKVSLSSRADGLGLSPLLQHPSMLIHPPIVILSYALWSVPAAVAASALTTGELELAWTLIARPWALCAWLVLGTGLLLGADWAYQELGWGGYWGWDPVENGSLIPWLTGTALVHSLMAWRHRGVLKKSSLALAILTFGLCNFATFLTRSGIFSSVHAFSESPIGWMFLGQMTVLLAGGTALVVRRRRQLVAERPVTSLASREAFVHASLFLLLMLTAIVIAGTLWIPVSQLLIGRMVQVGPDFYNNALQPIGCLLLAATAVVPLLRWGAAPDAQSRLWLVICGATALAAAFVAAGFGIRSPVALAVTSLSTLSIATSFARLTIDIRRLSPGPGFAAFHLLLRKHRREYAGYIVHLAFVCLAVGITGSALGTQQRDVELDEGTAIDWAGNRIEYVRLVQREEAERLVAEVELRVSRAGAAAVTLKPARHFHALQEQWTTEVAIDSTWRGDFYTILHAGLGDGRVLVTLIDKPMMRWIWFGGGLAAIGAVVAAWPPRRRRAQGLVRSMQSRKTPDAATVRYRRAA